MKTLHTIILAFSIMFATAQEQKVISSGGSSVLSNTVEVHQNIGEPIIHTAEGNNATATQGFHQPQLKIIKGLNTLQDISIDVFPNPTAKLVTIEFSNTTLPLNRFEIKLVNTKGQFEDITTTTNDNQVKLDVENLPVGQYIVEIVDQTDKSQKATYNVIKE